MYLSRFGVKNYKCLGEIDIPLTPIHVLIGQNDCGKTSLLEAMAAFFATSEKPVNTVFPQPWAGRELVQHANQDPRIELWGEWEKDASDDASVTFPGFKYRISVVFPLSGQTCKVADFVATNGEERRLSLDRFLPHPGLKTSLPDTSVKSWKEGNLQKNKFVEDIKAIAGILKPAHKYALDAKLMAVPAAFDSDRKFRLDSDGFGLATLLDDILGFNPELFLRLRADFCSFFPQFKSVRVESASALQRHYDNPDGVYSSADAIGKAIYFESKTGQTVRAQQASDGAILFLGLLALAHLPEPPGLLLLEEPENGVYPMRLGQIIKLLKEMVNRTEGVRFPQIILTTHSPYVLSFFEPEEVTLLSRPDGEPDAPVRARPLRDAPNIRERLGSDFYLGELWYNLSEGELFGDAPCQSGD